MSFLTEGILVYQKQASQIRVVEICRLVAYVANITELFGINEKTVLKWHARRSVEDTPIKPKERRGMVLTSLGEARSVRPTYPGTVAI